MEKYPKSFRKRFWRKFVIDEATGCWEWQKSCTKAGYGQLGYRRISPHKPLHAHRVAWEIKRGPIPDGLHVLHECDNPPCCNPDHLFLGTQKQNNEDRDRKGRTASGDRNGSRTHPERNPFVRDGGSGLKGEQHPMTKLSDAIVAEIREKFKAGVIKSVLAREYKVSNTYVANLVYRRIRK